MKWKQFFLLLTLFLALASCGTASTAATLSQPTTLQGERVTHTINYFAPLSRTVTRVEAVQTLYKAALALPKPSMTETRSCPADFGLIYHLRFLKNGTLVRQMALGASGCGYLLVEKNDMRVISQTFLTLFAHTIGILPSQVIVSPLPSYRKPVP